MDRQAIIDFLLDHYEQPRNYGALPNADATASGGNPDCGDLVTVYLSIEEPGGQIGRMQFEGQGCTISQAAASLLSEYVTGKTLDDIIAMDPATLMDLLGREVVASRPRCATLALGTLKTALARYRAQAKENASEQ